MAKASSPVGTRLPDNLKRRLETVAERHHRSLNAEIVDRLEASFESTALVFDEVFDALDLTRVQRMRSSSTYADAGRIRTVVQRLGIDKIVLGARKDSMNNAVLTFIAQTPHITLLMDTTGINMARDPREWEVQAIFRDLDRLGLLEHTRYCETYLPETSSMTPENALQCILSTGRLRQLDELSGFLQLLSVHGLFQVDEFQFTN